MRIRTATDLGAFIRERRTKLGMDQTALAKMAGTSRKWLVEVEQGKPGAEIAGTSVATPPVGKAKAPDINSVLNSLKKPFLKKQI
jgi:predicted transcriptional regulator